MGNLFASLTIAAQSLRTMQQGVDVAGNNIANARTPGFAKQDLLLVSKRFELDRGLPGGVETGGLIDSRRAYLEDAVRDKSSSAGRFAERGSALGRLEPLFDISSDSGIGGALDNLVQSFSQWSINPNDTSLRQRVIDRAEDLAAGFRFVSGSVAKLGGDLSTELHQMVGKVNRLGEQLAGYNVQVRGDYRSRQDPGLAAKIHAALEELSELVDVDVLRAEDGAFSIYLGGQTPLVIGEHFFGISADTSEPAVKLYDSGGREISGQVQGGRLKGLMEVRGSFLNTVTADLDTLARSVADRVNEVLAGGVDRNGDPPAVDLFAYDPAVGAAATLAVTGIRPEQLAGALPDAPGGNGNALNLAALGTSREIGDLSFTQFYGEVAGKIGRVLGQTKDEQETQSLLLAQARNLRADATEVDMNEEAAKVIAFQRQYEANAELVRVLNSLTETMLGLLR